MNRVETAASDQLHHVVMQPVLFADIEDGHDVRVVQPGRGLRFAPEPLLERGVHALIGALRGDG